MSDKQHRCDICDETENIQCEIFMSGDTVERVYHFCPLCLVDIYRRCIEDFLESSEYKVNSYIRTFADGLIINAATARKINTKVGDGEDQIDLIETFNPEYVRRTKPYCDEDVQ